MSGQLHTYKLLCVGSTVVLLINIDSFHSSLCVCVFYSIDCMVALLVTCVHECNGSSSLHSVTVLLEPHSEMLPMSTLYSCDYRNVCLVL